MGYTPFDNDADRLTHRPERVQKKSTKNKEIRKKKTLNHITGRKPFSVVRVEETNKKNGVPATRLEVWMGGYSKDNKPSNDKVADVMEEETGEQECGSGEVVEKPTETIQEEFYWAVPEEHERREHQGRKEAARGAIREAVAASSIILFSFTIFMG